MLLVEKTGKNKQCQEEANRRKNKEKNSEKE